MSTPDEQATSKGQLLIASYRATRLMQRPSLRTALRETYVQMRQARRARLYGASPQLVLADVVPPEPELAAPPGPEPVSVGSVFAELVSQAAYACVAETLVTSPAAAPPPEPPIEAALDQPEPPVEPFPTCATPAPADPPLAEIGFGPGMLIRLGQLGLHTIGDLARADAGELRSSLGAVSRLVDVETWISHARQAAGVTGAARRETRVGQ